jgi:dolichol-phosphate mannosyltransferase
MLVRAFYEGLKFASQLDLNGASDFKLLDKIALNAIKALPERSLFFRGLVSWIGFSAKQLHFTVPPRSKGKTKWTLFQLAALAISSVVSFTSYPLRFITVSGLLFFIFGMILGAQTIYNKYQLKGDVSGTTTIVILLLVTGSLILIALGIVGEYIARIYDEIKERPRYIINKIV